MQWLIIGSVIALFLIGSIIALWWWKLAARIAPYKDELGRENRSASNGTGNEDVVIIPTPPGSPRKGQR